MIGLNRRGKARLQYAAAWPRAGRWAPVLRPWCWAGPTGAGHATNSPPSPDRGFGILLHTHLRVEAAVILSDAMNVRGSQILLNEFAQRPMEF